MVNVNLSQYVENNSQNSVLTSPLFYLSLNPYPGPLNFNVSIPRPTFNGVKPKWCYSSKVEKVYAAKLVTFPINIKMDRFPPDASLIVCPIYTESSARTLSVNRCYLCSLKDPNPNAKNHVIQVEGSSTNYFLKDNRCMASLPLPTPAPGDSYSQIFVKMSCNTSCVGGPNRRPFSILVTLVLHNTEVGRQVIHCKCCEGPVRDMSKDEMDMSRVVKEDQESMDFEIKKIATGMFARLKSESKRRTKQKTEHETKLNEDYMKVPVRFQKKVKRYVNSLYGIEQMKVLNLPMKKLYPSETDSD